MNFSAQLPAQKTVVYKLSSSIEEFVVIFLYENNLDINSPTKKFEVDNGEQNHHYTLTPTLNNLLALGELLIREQGVLCCELDSNNGLCVAGPKELISLLQEQTVFKFAENKLNCKVYCFVGTASLKMLI